MNRIVWTVAVLCALAAGCARVNPRGDYERARGLIAARTGVEEIYEPGIDALVDEKVAALLKDGLTPDEAVRVALLRNRAFQAAFAEIGASRADVVQSGLLSNPTLSLSLRFPEGGGRSNLMLGLGQDLADLWQIPVRKRIAQAQLDQVVLEAARKAVDLASDVRIACARVLASRQAERFTVDSVRLVEQSLRLAEARFSAGETGRLDVNLVQANLLEVRLDLIGVRRDRRTNEVAAARVLGLSRWSGAWELTGELPPPSAIPVSDEELVKRALDNCCDARIALARVQRAEEELKRQYLRVFPSLVLGTELERTDRRSLPGRKVLADTARASVRGGALTAPEIQTRGQRALERRQIIDMLLGPTLQLTLPVWDQNQAEIAKARFEVLAQRKMLDDLLDTVADQVREAALAARAAAELARFYEGQSLPLARENVEAARRGYQAGEQNILVLIDAQEALIAQQRASINALRDYATAWAQLERALGGRMTAASAPASAPATMP